MPEINPYEKLLLENLAVVDRVGAAMGRRQGLGVDETADFIGWVRLRLVEDNYAILRKFRGESAFTTYLTVVIAMLARDHHVQQRGRWRASAAAIRRGSIAIRLETLVYRKGHSFAEAVQLLRTAGETSLSDRELTAIWSMLPRRGPMRPHLAGEEPLARVAGEMFADQPLAEIEIDAERRLVSKLMEGWIAQLPTEERLMLQMRFWQSMSVADIARALTLEPKPLYRQLDRLLERLRKALIERGVTAQRFGELFEETAS